MAEQYAGRTIDIVAWNTLTATGGMFDAQSTGQVVTGILKLAQRFLITFLHEPGSVKYNYWNRETPVGTTFMSQLRQGVARTNAAVSALFQLSEIAARQQLQAEETDDDPDDERYKKATLGDMTIDGDYLMLKVTIYSLADEVTLIVPIPSVPR